MTGYLLGLMLLAAPAPAVQAQAVDCPEEIGQQDKAIKYSLYYEDYKNDNFEKALPNLRWVIECSPEFPNKSDKNFTRLVDTYEGLAEASEDPQLRRAYLDSAVAVFDWGPTRMDEAGIEYDQLKWTLNKGRFIQTHGDDLSDLMPMVPEIYTEAYRMDPPAMDAYYIQLLIDNYVRSDEKQKAIDFMEEVEQSHAENTDLAAYITQMRDALFKTPEERIGFLETQLEKKPDDVEIIEELFNLYLRESYRGKAAALGERLLDAQPSARTYRLLAKMRLEDGEFNEALKLYEQALELPGSDDLKKEIYFNMGLANQNAGRLANARTYYRKALQEAPNYGQAYIAIGDLYAQAVTNCGSFEREDRAVYWLAVDYYERAKSVDGSVATAANQKIGTYRRVFPDQEALFFKGWKAGQSYRVDYGCYGWIGETTTVRNP